MSPRDQVAITAAAMRWHLARKRRLAFGPKARQAEQAANAISWFADRAAHGRTFGDYMNASEDFAAAKRKERTALRELTKLCEKAGADGSEVFEVDAPLLTLEVIA